MMEEIHNFKRVGFHYSYSKIVNKQDLIKFLYLEAKQVLSSQLKSFYDEHPGSSWKYHFEVKVRFDKLEEGEKVRETDTWFNTVTSVLHYLQELDVLLDQVSQ